MGEFVNRDSSDPAYVPDSKGAGNDVGKMLQAVALAQQLGKSVEEVLAFMGTKSNVPVPAITSVPQPQGELPEALKGLTIPLPVVEESVVTDEEAKELAPVKPIKEIPADGFVVTEVIDPKDATQAELDQAFPEEEDNWDGHIREGSKVRVTYSAPGAKIRLMGKIGKVTRVIGNEKAKVYEVEFKGQKIQKVRLNKKTNKLERGYENKKLSFTFDQEDIELYS